MTITSKIKNPEEPIKALISWYKHNQGTGKNNLLTGMISTILFENYKQRDSKEATTKELQGA